MTRTGGGLGGMTAVPDDPDTITPAERAYHVPPPAPMEARRSGPCESCLMGEHRCTGVGCWGCHDPAHRQTKTQHVTGHARKHTPCEHEWVPADEIELGHVLMECQACGAESCVDEGAWADVAVDDAVDRAVEARLGGEDRG